MITVEITLFTIRLEGKLLYAVPIRDEEEEVMYSYPKVHMPSLPEFIKKTSEIYLRYPEAIGSAVIAYTGDSTEVRISTYAGMMPSIGKLAAAVETKTVTLV